MQMPETHRRASLIEIIRRRVRLIYDPLRARHWTRMPRQAENGLNAISFMFPLGEAFFCRSVAHYRDRITDPVLKEQVAQFLFQEAMHSKEHARSNDALREANVLGAELEKVARVLLFLSDRLLLPSTRLAVTCALEHFTAMLAERLLARRWLYREGTDSAFANLWLWHAAEEIEHKAVCFDVYVHVFGRGFWAWLHRVAAMAMVTFFSAMGLLVAFAVIRVKLIGRKRSVPVSETQQAAPAGAVPPGGQPGAGAAPSLGNLFASVSAKTYLDYYRRDFHPWNQDDTALLEAWKQEHPGFGLPDVQPAPAAAAA